MRDDIWIERAALLEPFDGKGFTVSYVSRQTGLNPATVKSYASKFGFDFARRISKVTEPNKYEQRRIAVRELAAEGLTRKEVAERLGITVATVGSIGRELKIAFRHGSEGRGVDGSRAEAMAAMFTAGKTLQEIGDIFGVSRERVRQVLKKQHGIVGADGGQSAAAEQKRRAAKAKKDAYSLRRHGCLYEDYLMLVRIGKEIVANGGSRERTPAGAWGSQRQNAKARGIEWNLTLWDWWQIWQRSGKWAMRGRTKGHYVMCRFGDSGAYEVGNVYIATCSHNCSVQPKHPLRQNSETEGRGMNDLIHLSIQLICTIGLYSAFSEAWKQEV